MHKNQDKNFAAEKQRKREKRTRKRPKRAKPGAFWVLEGMRTVKGRCKRMGKTGKLGGNRGTDLSRLPARSARGRAPLALARPTTRTARGAAAPCCQDIPHANEKNQVPQLRYLIFLAGAVRFELTARGFGVDVGKCSKEQGRAGVAQFFRTNLSREVLVWCFTDLKRKKTPSLILLLAEYSIALVLPITLGISPCPLEGYRGYPVGRPARGQTRRFRCKICRRKAGG